MSLGIPQLEAFWSSRGAADSVSGHTLMLGLGLNILETYRYLYNGAPTLEQFETWILERNAGYIDPERIERLNRALSGAGETPHDRSDGPLAEEDLAFWDENGYVVLQDAVPEENLRAAAQAVYEFLEADPNDPASWYKRKNGHSIWVPAVHHPALWANRKSERIRLAFAQLWGTGDLWPTVDQGGLNPPETEDWKFPGPHLHWDTSIQPPIPLGLQGILYLTDTAENQGAFTCVPGFHRRIEAWLESLPPGADPRTQDLAALGAVPIAGKAGDLIIWHHALPHGSSPNRARVPRVVQYLSMLPARPRHNPQWK